MNIEVGGIPIHVEKKNIKNLHLSVKPPDGNVVISAPEHFSDTAVRIFARTNLGWIRRQIREFTEQLRFDKRQYVTGETLFIWGKQYFLRFEPSRKNGLVLAGNEARLMMRRESTVKQREQYMREQYRAMLKTEIKKCLPHWEKKTGIQCADCRTKYMTTMWGSCKRDKGRIWLNVQLAEKPIECLSYVVLHELVHFKDATHGALFTELMDRYMPNWPTIRKELNALELDEYVTK